MDTSVFYQRLLMPPDPWRVERVELSEDAGRVDVWLAHPEGTRFQCPQCGRSLSVYDHSAEREWRHLDTCKSTTWLHARLPRVRCGEHGTVQVSAPMSVPRSHITLGMETRCVDVLSECSVTGASTLTGLSWDQLAGIMERAVKRGMGRRPDSLPRQFGIDEKQVFSGQRYCTIVADLMNGTVIDVMEKRTVEALTPWFEERKEKLSSVEAVAMDMSAGYAKLVGKYAPQADICFDHFHVTQVMMKALDSVRKEEQRALPEELRKSFFRSRFLFLHNQENVPEDRAAHFDELKKLATRTARGWAIKENLRELWKCSDDRDAEDFFKKWFWWATHSRLEPVRKAAHTLKRHWDGIRNAISRGISNATVEGLNNKIEKIKRDAFGFRNKDRFRTAVLFHCGGLDLYPKIS